MSASERWKKRWERSLIEDTDTGELIDPRTGLVVEQRQPWEQRRSFRTEEAFPSETEAVDEPLALVEPSYERHVAGERPEREERVRPGTGTRISELLKRERIPYQERAKPPELIKEERIKGTDWKYVNDGGILRAALPVQRTFPDGKKETVYKSDPKDNIDVLRELKCVDTYKLVDKCDREKAFFVCGENQSFTRAAVALAFDTSSESRTWKDNLSKTKQCMDRLANNGLLTSPYEFTPTTTMPYGQHLPGAETRFKGTWGGEMPWHMNREQREKAIKTLEKK